MSDFSIELTDNALDSLVHGIEHLSEGNAFPRPWRKTDLKFAVLHVAHAAELFLKARLAKEDPQLIYRGPSRNVRTVDIETAMKRLLAAGVSLSLEQQHYVKSLQRYRNKIQHHRISESEERVRLAVGSAVHFMESFVQAELGLVLRDVIDRDLYRDMLYVTGAYEARSKEVRRRLELDLDGLADHELFDCPECGESETAPYPDPRKGVSGPECYVCGAEIELQDCAMCGTLTPGTICDDCSDSRD